MLFAPDLKRRHLVPERMDDPQLPIAEHELALRGLRRINRFSGTISHLAHTILDLAARRGLRSITVLDIGCANGENLIALHRRLSKHLSLTSIGWDISPYAIKSATSLTEKSGFNRNEIRFEQVDALAKASSDGNALSADIVINSLFMHHFDENAVVELLKRSASLARIAIVADDLNRTSLGWALAKIGCWILSRSPVVHFDGPQSVRAAFTTQEILALTHRAGLEGVQLTKHWPERYTLIWEKATALS